MKIKEVTLLVIGRKKFGDYSLGEWGDVVDEVE
jgi:hypothetical protein